MDMTNNKQQTPVEWYSRRLFEIEIAHNQGVINSDVYLKSKTHALEQAKEMEKEQIENAWYDGYLYEGRMPDHECVADTYYKKTYGGNQ
jgi:hypothetical protein